MPAYAYIIVILLSFFPLAMMLYKLDRRRKLIRYGVKEKAVILNIEKRSGAKGNIFYIMQVQYPLMNGDKLTGIHIFAGNVHPGFKKDNEVELYYNKEKPEQFILKHASRQIALLIITLILPVLVILAFIFVFRFLEH